MRGIGVWIEDPTALMSKSLLVMKSAFVGYLTLGIPGAALIYRSIFHCEQLALRALSYSTFSKILQAVDDTVPVASSQSFS